MYSRQPSDVYCLSNMLNNWLLKLTVRTFLSVFSFVIWFLRNFPKMLNLLGSFFFISDYWPLFPVFLPKMKIFEESRNSSCPVNSRKLCSLESFRTNVIFLESSGEIAWTTGGLKVYFHHQKNIFSVCYSKEQRTASKSDHSWQTAAKSTPYFVWNSA